jgi:peroxiredoxin
MTSSTQRNGRNVAPGTPSPALRFKTSDGTLWTLGERPPQTFTLVAFYRGIFCPYCREFISNLDRLADEFRTRGIQPIAVSVDSQEQVRTAIEQWKLTALPVGYGLDLDVARQWDLFISEVTREGRTSRFTEPGMFLIRPDNEIYATFLSSLPCGRPDLTSLIGGLDFLAKQGYPARGNT